MQRLTRATVFENGSVASFNSWSGSSATGAYNSSYSYDENGNLRELTRNGDNGANSYAMDAFTYNYTTGMNRLEYVDDAAGIADSDYSDDINSGQGSPNYLYDELGQLIFDDSEGMTLVWRNGNKKLASQENAGKRVEYIYNPFGQRVLKVEKNMSGGVEVPQDGSYSWKYTYYAYDANGQVMATYDVIKKTYTIGMSHFSHNESKVSEQNIYGAGRIGLINADKYNYANGYTALDGPKYTNKLGLKNYELTNHLGNVNAVITDRKVLDTDYSLGTWYEFTSSTPSWTTASGSPTTGVASGNLTFGTATAATASSYRTEATVGSKTYTFNLDISDRNAVSNFSIELYKNNTNDLVTPTLLKTFTSSELVNGTTISYTYTTASSGDDYFVCKLIKTSTETAVVKLDNLKFKKSYSRYKAVVIMKADYYPYGMVMPGRKWNNGNYRYGYNGMEQDVELKGNGNSYTTEFRQYDPRLGRWMSLDPLMAKFPWQSPYVGMDNNPVLYTDPMGLAVEGDYYDKLTGKYLGTDGLGDGKVYAMSESKWNRMHNENCFGNGYDMQEAAVGGYGAQEQFGYRATEYSNGIVANRYNDALYNSEKVHPPKTPIVPKPAPVLPEGSTVMYRISDTDRIRQEQYTERLERQKELDKIPAFREFSIIGDGIVKGAPIAAMMLGQEYVIADVFGVDGMLISTEATMLQAEMSAAAYIGPSVTTATEVATTVTTRTFTITAQDGDLIFYTTRVGAEVIEFAGNVSISDGVLTITNFDVEGAVANAVGPAKIREIMTEFGRQNGVRIVDIYGAPRTSGANPGKMMHLTFDINY